MRRFFPKNILSREALYLIICLLFFTACKKEAESYTEINVTLETPFAYRFYNYGDTVFIKGYANAAAAISKVELSLSDENFNAVSEQLIFEPKEKTFAVDTFLVWKDPKLASGDYAVHFKVYAGGFQQRDYTVVGYKEEPLELNGWMYGASMGESTVLYHREGLDLIPVKDLAYQTTFAHTVPEEARFIFAHADGVRAYHYLDEYDLWEKSSSNLFSGLEIEAYAFYDKTFYFGAKESKIRKLGFGGNSIATYDIAPNFHLIHMTAFKDQLFTAQKSVVGDQYQMVVYYDETAAVQTVVNMDVYGKPLAFFQKNERFFYILTEKDDTYRVYTYDIDGNTLSLNLNTAALDAHGFLQLSADRFCMIGTQDIYMYNDNTGLISTLTSVNYPIDHFSFEKESGTLFLMDEMHITQHNLYSNNRLLDLEMANDLSFVIPVYNK